MTGVSGNPRLVAHQTSNSTVGEGDTGGQKAKAPAKMRANIAGINTGPGRDQSGSMKLNRLRITSSQHGSELTPPHFELFRPMAPAH